MRLVPFLRRDPLSITGHPHSTSLHTSRCSGLEGPLGVTDASRTGCGLLLVAAARLLYRGSQENRLPSTIDSINHSRGIYIGGKSYFEEDK